MPPAARSVEELFPLIEFCKAGDLKAVSDWIAKGNPLDLPPGKKTRRASPLQIAIEKGFLTLTELLLDAGADPESNGNALSVAVRAKRIDIVRLLLDRGVPVNAVDFESVCYSCDPELIQLFLDRGADPITGYPIYRGFQNVVKPIIAVYKANIEAVPALQLQADMALCYFAKKGNLRCVSLLLWAGARPEAKIPEDDSKADFSDSCALEEAVRAGHLDVLKKLQPEKYPDRLPGLLQATFLDSSPNILQYLLTLLPDLSTLADSGSAILEHVLWQMGWAADPKPVFGTRETAKIDASIDAIEVLVKHGAKWKPEADSVSSARRYFRHLEPARILRVFTILKEHQAAEIAFLDSLVATPTMRAHLGDVSKKITHLFYPPPTKPPEPAASKPEPPPEPPPPASISELKARAETFILELIRNTPAFDFWKTELWESLENARVRRALGMSKEDERSCYEILEAAVEKINKRSRSFRVSVDGQRHYVSSLTVTLVKGKEWDDACNEVWADSSSDNPRRITDPAMKLLSWVKEHGSPNDWVKDSTLSWHAGFRGRQDCVGDYTKELRRKLGSAFCYEVRGQRWGRENPIEYKVWLTAEVSLSDAPPKKTIPERLNPVFNGNLDHFTKDDLDDWRDLIHNHLLDSQPTGTDPIPLLWIDDRAELERVFPSFPFGRHSDGDKIAKFLSEIRMHPGIKIGYDFRSETDVWFAQLAPAKSWEVTLQGLRDLRDQPTLEIRYGISRDAAKLLEWIEGLHDKDYLGKWTPIVQDELEKKIGIKCPWDSANLPAYLAELLSELNERTSYDLTLQPWKCYSEYKHRIRVSQKKSDEAVLIQQIQLLALKQGKAVPAERIREWISQLLK